MAKEIDDVLVYGRWRMIQNCRVFWSAQFLNTDQRFVVATLKLQLISRRIVLSQQGLDVGKLKDERVAEEFANRLSGVWEGLDFWGILKSCGVPSRPPSLMLPVVVWNSPYGEEEFYLSRNTGYH